MKASIIIQKIGAILTFIFMIFSPYYASAESIQFNKASLTRIEIQKEAIYPEGIDYNPNTDKFVVGSFREGAVYEVDENGGYHLLVQDERLHSVLAVRVDAKRNTLFVANSDIGASKRSYAKGLKKLASVGIYDLTSGKSINFIDLTTLLPNDNHLANDIALDDEGNAYVTDSFSPVIYKIDTDGVSSIFLQSSEFIGDGINLNGIVFHPDGYLIVVKKSEGTLFKIPLDAPKKFSTIKSDRAFIGGDGMILVNSQELVLIANRASGKVTETAFSLTSKDDWKTVKTTGQYAFDNVYPTTGTIKNDEIYVVHSNLNALVSAPKGEKAKQRKRATIEKIGTINPEIKAFVYTELQTSIPFSNVPWKKINVGIKKQPGFVNKTWLSGSTNNSAGGFYAFDTIKNAQKFVTEYFPKEAAAFGVAQTTRIFDADKTKNASRDINSVYYEGQVDQRPGAYVYTEVQVNIPSFDEKSSWREINPIIKNKKGVLSKTWLSGIHTGTVGGFYAFDTLENAKEFAIEDFPIAARKRNAAFYTRVFDAHTTEEASLDIKSPFYK
mgnify:CR=1 FL=1